MPEERLHFLVLDQNLGLILCLRSSLLTCQILFSGRTAWSALMTRGPLLHSLEYPSSEGQCLWEDVWHIHNNLPNCIPLVLCWMHKRIAWSGWHGCSGCVSWQKPPGAIQPSCTACCIIFFEKDLFHQLKSASRRQMTCNFWTKTFPTIFSRRTVRPFPHHASNSLFLAQIDSLAACSNKRSRQKEAAI